MKRLNNVWSTFSDEETLLTAIRTAAKGKRKYRKVRRVLKKDKDAAHELSVMLNAGKFKPSPYKVDKIKTEYGKEREIFKLPFYPDRCVQHGISQVMRKKWDNSLTSDTYACLPGRGINCKKLRYNLNHKVKRAIRSFGNKRVYIFKMGSSGIWSDGYCEWYIDNLYALCVTICILSCSYASTHLNTIEPFVGANYSF